MVGGQLRHGRFVFNPFASKLQYLSVVDQPCPMEQRDQGMAGCKRVLPNLHLLIHGEDQASHHPAENHPQHGQPLILNRLGVLPQSVLDESRDVDRLAWARSLMPC
jgi:hypothetical protein